MRWAGRRVDSIQSNQATRRILAAVPMTAYNAVTASKSRRAAGCSNFLQRSPAAGGWNR